jgi:hypothetical protein
LFDEEQKIQAVAINHRREASDIIDIHVESRLIKIFNVARKRESLRKWMVRWMGEGGSSGLVGKFG